MSLFCWLYTIYSITGASEQKPNYPSLRSGETSELLAEDFRRNRWDKINQPEDNPAAKVLNDRQTIPHRSFTEARGDPQDLGMTSIVYHPAY